MNPEDKLIDKRFGRLVITGEYIPGRKAINKPNHFSARVYPSVMCKCDCGNYRRINVGALKSGATTSCGCFRKEQSIINGRNAGKIGGLKQRKYSTLESSARDLFQKYMKRHPGDLTFEKFNELTQQQCYYCNDYPHQKYLVKNATDNLGTYIYNGLDRVDNNKGYDTDNVRPCCGRCNFMRQDQSVEEFYKQLMKIFTNRKDDLGKIS